jgi:hypothetical protein
MRVRHVEGQSTMFGTALNYAALRILGVSAEHPVCVKARGTLHRLGMASFRRFNRSSHSCQPKFQVAQLQRLLGENSGLRR